MGLILNECRKQKRHRPLRHLFQYSGEALRGLKPCWMMSPGTLASLVPREAIEQFDLVIVDEASQMPPERAFGLISRARQCVVVGDPKQLPPTSFFQRTASVDESDADNDVDTEVLDEESILDLCTKTFHPVRRLKWHYRSRHGSLIAFSNKHFYNSELVVFPSCDRDFAIHRHLVSDARYTKSVNLPEVRLVCDVVLEQLEQYPDRSLGVVAMNEAQASEIGEQLEMLSLHHEELRRRLELKDTSEELFVKSLEKVQGDERDTIVISCTYGPSEPGGPVAMRFGPINQQGGHRRLNVLFTRAKRAIELVTSIESHQIQPTATSSQGIHAFRNYLKFVESQSLETGRPSGREPDSPFEVVVAEAIQRHGYEVDCQVGVANYFIDLAIRHPDKPDTYMLGVECDGATYHSARAARDRDKYRQAVLEGLGWQIYRIWSTDWFENADTETRKLVKHLRQLQNDRRK
jgi:very-short-patch-repair endonuclease